MHPDRDPPAPASQASRGSCGKAQSLALNHSLLDRNLGGGHQERALSQKFPQIIAGALSGLGSTAIKENNVRKLTPKLIPLALHRPRERDF